MSFLHKANINLEQWFLALPMITQYKLRHVIAQFPRHSIHSNSERHFAQFRWTTFRSHTLCNVSRVQRYTTPCCLPRKHGDGAIQSHGKSIMTPIASLDHAGETLSSDKKTNKSEKSRAVHAASSCNTSTPVYIRFAAQGNAHPGASSSLVPLRAAPGTVRGHAQPGRAPVCLRARFAHIFRDATRG